MSNKTVVYDEERRQFALEEGGGGGGSDYNPYEMHRVIVTDGGSRTITDFKGTITIVANGLETLNSFTLNWNGLETETEKLTIIFTVSADVSHTTSEGVSTLRLPTSVINGDVWEVVYDKFYNIWNLVSVNNTSSFDPIPELENGQFLVGGSDGNTHRKIVKEDLNMASGTVLCTHGTTGAFNGMPFAATAAPNTFPVRDFSGRVAVADGTAQDNAINLKQLEERTPIGTNRQVMGYEDGVIKAVTLGWMEFSDLETPPSFPTGLLAGTTFNPDGRAMFYFHELNDAIDASPKERTIPVYATGGVMKVANGVANTDAVNLGQLNERAGTDLPLYNNANANAGTSTLFAREDHVHPLQATVEYLSAGRTFYFTGGMTATSPPFNGSENITVPTTLAVPTETVRGGVLKQANIPDLGSTATVDVEDINEILAVLRGAGLM